MGSKYEMLETATRHIRDAGDELMYAEGAGGAPDKARPMRITMYGPGSSVYQKAAMARTAKALKKFNKLTTEQQAELAAKAQIEFLVDTTKEFENMEELAPGATGRDLIAAVYGNDRLSFVRDQAATLQNETANFNPGSSKS